MQCNGDDSLKNYRQTVGVYGVDTWHLDCIPHPWYSPNLVPKTLSKLRSRSGCESSRISPSTTQAWNISLYSMTSTITSLMATCKNKWLVSKHNHVLCLSPLTPIHLKWTGKLSFCPCTNILYFTWQLPFVNSHYFTMHVGRLLSRLC